MLNKIKAILESSIQTYELESPTYPKDLIIACMSVDLIRCLNDIPTLPDLNPPTIKTVGPTHQTRNRSTRTTVVPSLTQEATHDTDAEA